MAFVIAFACFDSVTIRCPKCRQNYVNSNDQLVFEAIHSGFGEQEMLYDWELSVAGDFVQNSAGGRDHTVLCRDSYVVFFV